MADIATGFYTQANPNALLDTAQQAVGVRNAQATNALLGVDLQQKQQDLVKNQVGYLSSGFAALANKPDITPADFYSFGQRALQEGIISPQTYQAEAANVAAAGNDPTKLQALAGQYLTRTMDAGTQFAAQFGYAPGAGATPTNVPAVDANGNPTGATQTIPLSQFARASQPSPLVQPAPPSVGSAAPSSSIGIHPAAVGDRAQQLAQATGQAPAAGPPSQRPFVTPSPQQQAQFNASAQQQQADLANDAGFTSNIVPLTKTLDLLPKTPLFGTGAEVPTQVAKVLNTFGIKVGSDQAQNASELDKYLTQLARSSGAAPNSDSQLAAAFSANPNMTTDRAAAQDVVKTMLSLSRMQHAKVLAAQAAGVAPEQYSTFASKWGAAQDPRAYGFDLMTPEAKGALKAQLQQDPAAAQRFISSYNTAQQLGIFGQ